MINYVFGLLFFLTANAAHAQPAEEVVAKLKNKLVAVKDYEARGQLKTDVAFLKIPVAAVKIYYKYPDQFKIQKDGGISLLPKGGIKINLNSLIAEGNYTSLSAGRTSWKGADLAVIKLIPLEMASDIVLTTLYVDDKQFLIRKSITTTRDNGTYEMEMEYGKYVQWGLPDKAVMVFNTKDYALPKGITFEYEAGVSGKVKEKKPQSKQGRVEILYSSYSINKGLPKLVF
jgi:hypothetical protein